MTYSQEEVDEAVEMYRRGDKIADIVAQIGCTEQTLWRWAKEAGVPKRLGTVHKNVHRGPRRPRTKQPVQVDSPGYSRVLGAPYWPYNEETDRTECPAGCGFSLGWDDLTRDHIARSDDPDDLTKAMLVAQWDHTEGNHPETVEVVIRG